MCHLTSPACGHFCAHRPKGHCGAITRCTSVVVTVPCSLFLGVAIAQGRLADGVFTWPVFLPVRRFMRMTLSPLPDGRPGKRRRKKALLLRSGAWRLGGKNSPGAHEKGLMTFYLAAKHW